MNRLVGCVGILLGIFCSSCSVDGTFRISKTSLSTKSESHLGAGYVGTVLETHLLLDVLGPHALLLSDITSESSAIIVPAMFSVRPGQPNQLPVRWHIAEAGPFETMLRFDVNTTVGPTNFAIRLTGEGKDIPECLPAHPCSTASFNLETNRCEEQMLPDGTACDDGNACTEQTRCTGGECLGHAKICDDGVACTTDLCEPSLGCLHLPNNGLCSSANAACLGENCDAADDACLAYQCDPHLGCVAAVVSNYIFCGAESCSSLSWCVDGQCLALEMDTSELCNADSGCDDGNPCTIDYRNLLGQCVHEAHSGSCDDGNPCTVNTTCALGTCLGDPRVCDDGIACTADVCVAGQGCVHTPQDSHCSASGICTTGRCDATLGCIEEVRADGSYCAQDLCAEQGVLGQCEDGTCSPVYGAVDWGNAQVCGAPSPVVIDVPVTHLTGTIDLAADFPAGAANALWLSPIAAQPRGKKVSNNSFLRAYPFTPLQLFGTDTPGRYYIDQYVLKGDYRFELLAFLNGTYVLAHAALGNHGTVALWDHQQTLSNGQELRLGTLAGTVFMSPQASLFALSISGSPIPSWSYRPATLQFDPEKADFFFNTLDWDAEETVTVAVREAHAGYDIVRQRSVPFSAGDTVEVDHTHADLPVIEGQLAFADMWRPAASWEDVGPAAYGSSYKLRRWGLRFARASEQYEVHFKHDEQAAPTGEFSLAVPPGTYEVSLLWLNEAFSSSSFVQVNADAVTSHWTTAAGEWISVMPPPREQQITSLGTLEVGEANQQVAYNIEAAIIELEVHLPEPLPGEVPCGNATPLQSQGDVSYWTGNYFVRQLSFDATQRIARYRFGGLPGTRRVSVCDWSFDIELHSESQIHIITVPAKVPYTIQPSTTPASLRLTSERHTRGVHVPHDAESVVRYLYPGMYHVRHNNAVIDTFWALPPGGTLEVVIPDNSTLPSDVLGYEYEFDPLLGQDCHSMCGQSVECSDDGLLGRSAGTEYGMSFCTAAVYPAVFGGPELGTLQPNGWVRVPPQISREFVITVNGEPTQCGMFGFRSWTREHQPQPVEGSDIADPWFNPHAAGSLALEPGSVLHTHPGWHTFWMGNHAGCDEFPITGYFADIWIE